MSDLSSKIVNITSVLTKYNEFYKEEPELVTAIQMKMTIDEMSQGVIVQMEEAKKLGQTISGHVFNQYSTLCSVSSKLHTFIHTGEINRMTKEESSIINGICCEIQETIDTADDPETIYPLAYFRAAMEWAKEVL